MKSCPTCNRTYPDDAQVFCLMDGAVLSAPYDASETRAAPRQSSEPPTEVISAPAKPAEARAPLQSTIRAPVPQVPDLYQPATAPSKQSEVTVVSSSVRGSWTSGSLLHSSMDFCIGLGPAMERVLPTFGGNISNSRWSLFVCTTQNRLAFDD